MSFVCQLTRQQSTTYPRLLRSHPKYFADCPLKTGDAYKRDVTASVVFEIAPCGNIPHAQGCRLPNKPLPRVATSNASDRLLKWDPKERSYTRNIDP
jgi:hypothetical protein